jgi:hypothetical protein
LEAVRAGVTAMVTSQLVPEVDVYRFSFWWLDAQFSSVHAQNILDQLAYY